MDVTSLNTPTGSPPTPAASTANQTASADRFLKLLVTQMQNQDPLNPMDNAQVTSQMAQINTVEGINTLNQTVKGLNAQFTQLQALQGASLVGRGVLLQGNLLDIAQGQGRGAFDLAGPADRVQVQVVNPAGAVIDTLDMGALSGGRHEFAWPSGGAGPDAGLSFKVVARTGSAEVPAAALMHDTVRAVAVDGDGLRMLLQRGGEVAYSQVRGFD